MPFVIHTHIHRMLFSVILPLVSSSAFAVASSHGPSGLLCNFQASPALGVTSAPQFTWQVPPCASQNDARQQAYRLVVTSELSGAVYWDSGQVVSNSSVGVVYKGPSLAPGTSYTWSVSTRVCDSWSPASTEPAVFVTQHFKGFAKGAAWIWSHKSKGMFAFLRKQVDLPAGKRPARAIASIHAMTDDYVLCGFKLYIAGKLAGVGPGRGEAAIWGGRNGSAVYSDKVYSTFDVTNLLPANGSSFVIAIASVGSDGDHGGNKGRGVLLQLDLHYSPPSSSSSIVTDTTWAAFDADAYHMPGTGHNWYKHVLEGTDARKEPIGWRSGTMAVGNGWTNATAVALAADPKNAAALRAKMSRPVTVADVPAVRIVKVNETFGLAIFPREFQGGLRLSVADPKSKAAGARVRIVSGESRVPTWPKNRSDHGPPTNVVGDTWGYDFTWTLRDGAQTIEQHQYMEFRYVNVFLDLGNTTGNLQLDDIQLSAWACQYEWSDDDSYFTSSNATLNSVYQQSRYTTRAGLLDTFTDSNTRERRPYEADGLVAASSHLLLQRDVLFSRHSSSYVFEYPTWPVEWVQISVLLAWQDYWATGSTDLGMAYSPLLANNTRLMDADSTGLLNCSSQARNGCSPRPGKGHHIVDWFPGPSGRMFHSSEHLSVNNFFCLRGLRILAALSEYAAGGDNPATTSFTKEANTLAAAMQDKMWFSDGNKSMFCDGICSDVGNHTGVTTNAWGLFTSSIPEASIPAAWRQAAAWGAEGFGAYGVFVYLSALNSFPDGDDGTTMLRALTKCDTQSWCAEIRHFNATMTRESWGGGTYSHPWGTGPITGVTGGIMGIMQTGPAWQSLLVKPRLGGNAQGVALANASIKVPTLRGPIVVHANRTHTTVQAPCGTRVTLCARHYWEEEGRHVSGRRQQLVVDGKEFPNATVHAFHMCAEDLGCGASGAPRVATVV